MLDEPKVFITGGTGYIGGDALFEIVALHPGWHITCLVRNSDKGAKIAAVYPRVTLVYGDLDSTALIEEEASKADIIYHFANCDHEASAKAISRGIARRSSDGPGFWIHTSGTQILGLETTEKSCYGDELEKVFNDWDLVDELTSRPDPAAHRQVDKIVLAASLGNPEKIKTAIVCPPTIYGVGRGPDNRRSIQVYGATKAFLERGKAFMVGKGANIWHQVHIQDLSTLYVHLGEAACAGGPPATWNEQGYYLVENGPFVWGEILKSVAIEAHKLGLLESPEVESLSPSDAESYYPAARRIATNSRGQAIRARKLLDWQPKQRTLADEISTIVDGEARALNLLQGHAAKVEQ